MPDIPYINIHTHHPKGQSGLLEIENLRVGQAPGNQAAYCSVGLHPWFLSEASLDKATTWLGMQAIRSNVIAIGEAGLDKVTGTPWPLQLDAFQRCFEVSESTQKPLLIHCVRSFAEIIALKKRWKPRQPWIFHGFDKNIQTAEMLLKEGCLLSFGAAVFRAKSHSSAILSQIPADRFFLETDDAAFPIVEIYQQAAELRGITLEALKLLQLDNFQKVFQNLMKM